MTSPLLNTGSWTKKLVDRHSTKLSVIEKVSSLAILVLSALGIAGFIPTHYFTLGCLGATMITFAIKAIQIDASKALPKKELFNTLLLVLAVANLLFPILAISGNISVQTTSFLYLTEGAFLLAGSLAYKGVKAAFSS